VVFERIVIGDCAYLFVETCVGVFCVIIKQVTQSLDPNKENVIGSLPAESFAVINPTEDTGRPECSVCQSLDTSLKQIHQMH